MAAAAWRHPGVDLDPWDDEYGAPWWFAFDTQERWTKRCREMFTDNIDTQDALALNQWTHHLVFVYGTLKKGFSNSYMMQDATYVGKAWTKLKCFKMVESGCPAVLFDSGQDSKQVQGEVYMVDITLLKDLDRFESNGRMYQRHKIQVETEKGVHCKPWMYLGKKGVFCPKTMKSSYVFNRKKTKEDYFTYLEKAPKRK